MLCWEARGHRGIKQSLPSGRNTTYTQTHDTLGASAVSDCTTWPCKSIHGCLRVGLMHFWAIDRLQSESSSLKGRTVLRDPFPPPSHKGKLLADEENFYGYPSESQGDISIPPQ